MQLALVGKNGSGKSTAASFFEAQGFAIISLSDFIREEATLQGLPHTRDNLTTIGNHIKDHHGTAHLAQKALARAKELNLANVIFDSVRHPDEVDTLKRADVFILGLTVDISTRFERAKERQSERDTLDFDTFVAQDKRESEGSSSGQNLNASLDLCNHIIENNGSVEELQQALFSVLGV